MRRGLALFTAVAMDWLGFDFFPCAAQTMELCQTSGSLRRLTFRIFTLLSFYLWHLTLVLLSYNWSLLNFIIFSSRFCRRKGTDSCFYILGILSSCHLLNKKKLNFKSCCSCKSERTSHEEHCFTTWKISIHTPLRLTDWWPFEVTSHYIVLLRLPSNNSSPL